MCCGLRRCSAAASSIRLWRWRERHYVTDLGSSSFVSRDMGVPGFNPSFVSVLGRGDESVISRVRLGCSS